jgi:hypothetical protein
MPKVKDKNAARLDEVREVFSKHVLEAMEELPGATADETAMGICTELAIYITRAYPPDLWEQQGAIFATLLIDFVSAAAEDFFEDLPDNPA